MSADSLCSDEIEYTKKAVPIRIKPSMSPIRIVSANACYGISEVNYIDFNMAQGIGEGFGREMRGVEKSIRKATDNAVPDNDNPRPRRGGRPETRFEVVQNIYANETSYAQQQREAARQFRMIAREVMT